LPTGDDVKGAVENILAEIKDIKSNVSTDLQIGTKQKTDSLAGGEDVEFRPLTEEEKKAFVNSLDAKARTCWRYLPVKQKVQAAFKLTAALEIIARSRASALEYDSPN